MNDVQLQWKYYGYIIGIRKPFECTHLLSVIDDKASRSDIILGESTLRHLIQEFRENIQIPIGYIPHARIVLINDKFGILLFQRHPNIWGPATLEIIIELLFKNHRARARDSLLINRCNRSPAIWIWSIRMRWRPLRTELAVVFVAKLCGRTVLR